MYRLYRWRHFFILSVERINMIYWEILNCFIQFVCVIVRLMTNEIIKQVRIFIKLLKSYLSWMLLSVISVKNRRQTMMKWSHLPINNQNLLLLNAVYMTKPYFIGFLCLLYHLWSRQWVKSSIIANTWFFLIY